MTNLLNYLEDGANYQARAVLMFVQRNAEIEASWNKETKEYDAEIKVARWENCREQGYVLSLKSPDYSRQLNIAFFEHRNSDSICAVKWEQVSVNSLTIDSAIFGNVYNDKYDTSFDVSAYKVKEMADWIKEQFNSFYTESKIPAKDSAKTNQN